MEERNQSTSSKVKETLTVIFMVAVAFAVGTFLTRCSAPGPNPLVGVSVKEAPINPVVKNEEKVDVPVSNGTVRVYPSDVKASLALPAPVIADDRAHPIASIRLSASETPREVTAVLNDATGETVVYTADVATPVFALENRGSFGVDFGIKPDRDSGVPTPAARINLRQDIVQTKAIHWGASASVYSDGDYFVGLGGQLRW